MSFPYRFPSPHRAGRLRVLTEFFILMDIVLGLNLPDVVKESHFIHSKAVVLIAQAIADIIAIGKDIWMFYFDINFLLSTTYSFPLSILYSRLAWLGCPLKTLMTLSTASV